MEKKAQVGVPILVIIVGLAIGLIVLLLVTGAFAGVFESLLEKNKCQWNLFIHAMSKDPLTGMVNLPAECKMEKINVTKKMLDKDRREARNRISYWQSNQDKYDKLDYFNSKNEDKLQNEYVMDKIIAEEMEDCWEKAWMGKMPLFDEWWNLVTWKDKNGNEIKDFPDDAFDALEKWWENGEGIGIRKPPTFCLVCTRIKFSGEVKDDGVLPTEINSLKEWMMNNPVQGDAKKRSYYEYFAYEDVEGDGSKIYLPKYDYSTDEAYAVVFARVNVFKITEKWDQLINAFSSEKGDDAKAVNTIYLMKYSEINDVCSYTIG